jgi:predicted alpha/beta-fold hydrolase
MNWRGHYWTLYPHVRGLVRRAPRGTALWSGTVHDPRFGAVELRGEWTDVPGAREAAVVVHGLGGRPDGELSRAMAGGLVARGVAALSLGLRGADRSGEDIYHGGLVDDVLAALACPELARFEHLYLLGFSMGGHVALHAARADLPSRPGAPDRLRAVVAICAPLDLAPLQRHIDEPQLAFYRGQVLRGLREIHAAVAVAHPERVPEHATVEAVRRLRTVRAFDEAVICPRHGFASPEAYYEAIGIAPHLGSLAVPSLLVATERDPMVPIEQVRAAVADAGRTAAFELVVSERGGHMGFPPDTDLGFGDRPGLTAQVLAWARGVAGLGAG